LRRFLPSFGKFAADIFVYNRIYTAQLEAENDLRSILNPFPGEVRSASPSDRGDYPILLAEEKEFIFYTDVDFNKSRERVRYFIEDDTFRKGFLSHQEILRSMIQTMRSSLRW